MPASRTVVAIAFLAATGSAQATGMKAPTHSQLTYSFTCPSGASGHVSYMKDFGSKQTSELRRWVNGNYLQDDPRIADGIKGRNIEQLDVGCEGDRTIILLRTFDLSDPNQPMDSRVRWFTIYVDRAGKVVSAD